MKKLLNRKNNQGESYGDSTMGSCRHCRVFWLFNYTSPASIDGKFNGLRGLLSSDGPDPSFTSYSRMTAGSLSAIKTLLDQEIERKNRH